MSYLLTNAEYYISRGKPVVRLYGRDTHGLIHAFDVSGPNPYFYAGDKDGEYKGLTREGVIPCKKIICQMPNEVPHLRRNFLQTFEADVPYALRFLVDRGIWAGFDFEFTNGSKRVVPAKPPNIGLTICHVDIEVEVDKESVESNIKNAIEGNRLILTVVAWFYDSNTDELKKFNVVCRDEQSEYVGLTKFRKWIKGLNDSIGIDVFTGWNPQFDWTTIVNRCKRKSINIDEFSPMNYVSQSQWSASVKIKGCQIVDLKQMYQKYFQGKTMESYKLDDLASRSDKYGLNMPHPHFDYERYMNRNHLDIILPYNEEDVEKCFKFDKKFGLVKHFDHIRRATGAFLNDTLTTGGYVESLVLRLYHDYMVLPSRQHHDKIEYAGAFVKRPKKGLFEWVLTLDFSQMYPTIIISRNMSPDTMSRREPEDVENWHHIDGVYFKKEPMGKVPEMFMNLSARRKEIKKEMWEVEEALKIVKTEEGKKELEHAWDILDLQQYSIKQILAAMYGYFANEHSRLYYPEISKSTTYIGRFLINTMMKYMEDKGYVVIYGDTDSMLVKVNAENIEQVREIGEELEKELNNLLEDWAEKEKLMMVPKLEFEQAYKKILFIGKASNPNEPAKKRYAGWCTFNKGKPCDEIMIKGFEIRRSDSSKITREVQQELFDLILRKGANENEIRNYLKGLIYKFKERPLEEIGIPLPLKMNPDDYDSETTYQAVLYYNRVLAKSNPDEYKPIKGGDRPKVIHLKRTPDEGRMWLTNKKNKKSKFVDVKRIALMKEMQYEEWKDKVNWDVQIEKVVSDKINKILEIIDLSMDLVMQDQTQTKLEQWF